MLKDILEDLWKIHEEQDWQAHNEMLRDMGHEPCTLEQYRALIRTPMPDADEFWDSVYAMVRQGRARAINPRPPAPIDRQEGGGMPDPESHP